MKKTTLVMGASINEARYSNKAIIKLKQNKHEVLALGLRKGNVADISIDVEKKEHENVDTVTLYLNPKRQEAYYEYIISLKPRRVVFNPGTENDQFVKLLDQNHIESEVACTLVLLATNQY
jgi:predicted CoA-binding protein